MDAPADWSAPLDNAALSLGLRGAMHTPDTPFTAAIHPSMRCLALAHGACLSILPLSCPGDPSIRPGAVRRFNTDITCLAWLAVLKGVPAAMPGRDRRSRSASPQQPTPALQQQPIERQQQQLLQQQQDACAREQLLEHVFLMSGTEDGCLQLHDGDTGRALFRQRLHTSAALSLHLRTCQSGLKQDDPVEDLTVCFANALVRIPYVELHTLLRLLQLAAQTPEGAVAIPPLTPQRWELPAGVGPRRAGICLGFKPRSLYTLLTSDGRPAQRQSLCLIAAGERPPLAAFEVEENSTRSTLQLITGVASSLTTGMLGLARAASRQGVLGLARAAGQQVTSYGVDVVTQSVRPWLPSNPLAALDLHSHHDAGDGDGGDGDYAPPAPCYEDPKQLPKAQPATPLRAFGDDPRVVTELVPAPVGALVATADALGRVSLVDGAALLLLRMWKGYRDAQCGWLLPPPGHPWHTSGALLVLYAPKRQTVEVWAARGAERLASILVQRPCRLLTVQQPLNSWGNPLWREWDALCPATTYVLDTQSGAMWDVARAALLAPQPSPAQQQQPP